MPLDHKSQRPRTQRALTGTRSPADASVRLAAPRKPLLQTVGGRPRSEYDMKTKAQKATSAAKRPAEDEEDLERSPESSEHESDKSTSTPLAASKQKTGPVSRLASTQRRGAAGSAAPAKRSIRAPRQYAPRPFAEPKESPPTGNKRKRDEPPSTTQQDSDSDGPIFGGLPSSSQPRTTYGGSSQAAKTNLFASSSQERTSGGKSADAKPQRPAASSQSALKLPPSFAKPQFQMPMSLPDHERIAAPAAALLEQINSNDDALDSSSEPEADDAVAVSDVPATPRLLAKCPVCKGAVSRAALQAWNNGDLSTWRAKSSFCNSHKEATAQAKAAAKVYPDVDWAALPQRIAKFDADVGAILEHTRPSHYRDELLRRIEAGQSHTLFNKESLLHLNASDTVVPGYYGARGARMMQEHILNTFAGRIRQAAVTDKVVPAVGPSGFVQCVLAPELAVMLVMEDYASRGGITAERARQVISESADVGELLHADVAGSTQLPMVVDLAEDDDD